MNKLFRKLFLISLLAFISDRSYCQVATDTIKVNFLDMASMPKFETVIYSKTYVFKVLNLNQSLYKIESSASQQDFNTELPSIFKGIKLPGYLNLSLPNSPAASAVKSLDWTSALATDDYKTLIKDNLALINASSKKIAATAELNNKMKNIFSTCGKPYDEIQTSLINLVNEFLRLKLTERKAQEDALKSTLETVIKDAVNAGAALDTLVPLYLYSISQKIKTNSENIILNSEKESSGKKNNNSSKDLEANKSAKDENAFLNSYKDSIKIIVAKAADFVTEIKKFRDDNKVQDLVNNYNMINNANFTYTTEPVKIKSDEVKFEIKIVANKQLPCSAPTKVTISETYKTVGGCKIDFSTGVFFNGGSQDFLGRDLQYVRVNDTLTKIQSKDGGKRALLSVGALMHVYYRCGSKINLALSSGLSTSTAFDGLNFHLGGSLLLGRENRIVISGGLTFKESKILDRTYSYDTPYLKKNMPDSPPTIKVFPQIGWFCSLTYNFSKFKSK